MAEVRNSARLLYTKNDELTVGELRSYMGLLDDLPDEHEINVDIQDNGHAFALEIGIDEV